MEVFSRLVNDFNMKEYFNNDTFKDIIRSIRKDDDKKIKLTNDLIDRFSCCVIEIAEELLDEFTRIIEEYGDNEENSINSLCEKVLIIVSEA